MRQLNGLAAILLLAIGGGARADNVDVILACGGCITNPDPAILDIGDTLTFTCAPDCAASGCSVSASGGTGISGITPFAQLIDPGETGSPLGPATTGGEFAAVYVFNDLCFPSFIGGIRTRALIPTLAPSGVVVVAMLVLAAGFVVFMKMGLGGRAD